jgi:hypothetical protein
VPSRAANHSSASRHWQTMSCSGRSAREDSGGIDRWTQKSRSSVTVLCSRTAQWTSGIGA